MMRKYFALVVDDDEAIRNLMKRALATQDIDADGARDGAAAAVMLGNRKYDAVITDLRMPRMHGHTLVQEILQQDGHRPLVCVVTGIVEPKLTLDLFRRGVNSLDQKPLKYKEFAAKLRGMLEFRALRPEPAAEEAAMPSSEQVKSQLEEVVATFQDAIDRLKRQHAELESGYLGSVRLLSGLMDHSGKSTGIHANRVEAMAAFIGQGAGLSADELRDLKVAAQLHEIGQFSMPDRVRSTPPWELTPEDRTHYENYPSLGATLLSEIPGTEPVVEIIENHQEHFDGSGFPAGRSGEAIPIAARILCLADAFDTRVMHARSVQPLEEALEHLAKRNGAWYDPALFKFVTAWIEQPDHSQWTRAQVQVAASALRPGMELGESIYDESGRLLARRGATLSKALAQRLNTILDGRRVAITAQASSPKTAP